VVDASAKVVVTSLIKASCNVCGQEPLGNVCFPGLKTTSRSCRLCNSSSNKIVLKYSSLSCGQEDGCSSNTHYNIPSAAQALLAGIQPVYLEVRASNKQEEFFRRWHARANLLRRPTWSLSFRVSTQINTTYWASTDADVPC